MTTAAENGSPEPASALGGAPRRGLFATLAEQRRFIYLATALLTAAGVWATFRLPSAIYPELTFSRITVLAEGGALGARPILFSVTRPIEEAVSTIPGVARVRSRAIRGSSQTDIDFTPRTDMVVALQQVQARVNQVQPELPAGLQFEIERLTPSLFPIVSYNLEGGDPPTLYDIARYDVKPLFARVPGVGRVDVLGTDVLEIEVIADPARLAAHRMTFDELAAAISASTTVTAIGRMPANYKQYLIVTANEAHSLDDVANVVIARDLRVRDVASVVHGTEDHTRIVSGDGRPAALISVSRQVGGNSLTIADSVAAIAASLRHTLPSGVTLKPVYDQPALIRDAVRSVRDAMAIGALLAVVVLLVFLRHARITAISAAAIPLTMTIAIGVMALVGQTFNLMTLGAMAIAIGLVIDDAVVITENIVRHLHLLPDRAVAIRDAVQELIWPVTTSTLTTVVVFLPLGLLTGVEGQFFKALSITLTSAVLISLLVALTVIPLLSEQFLTARDADAEATDPAARVTMSRRLGGVIDGLALAYERTLGRALSRARWMVPIAVVLLAGGVVAYRFADTGFLPDMDEGAFILDYWTPGGTALAETDRELHVVENLLMQTPGVAAVARRTGAELGMFVTEQNTGDIIVRLAPPDRREQSMFDIIDEVRPKIEAALPRLRVEFVGILSDVVNDLAGNAHPVEVKLFGPDLDSLEAYAQRLAPLLEKIDGIEDLYDGVSEQSAELSMEVNGPEAARSGLTTAQIADAAAGALLGEPAGDVRVGDRPVHVRVRAPDSVRYDPRQLGAIPVVSPATGGTVPLGMLATFSPGEARSELLRENQQQNIVMTADLSGRSAGAVTADVKEALAAAPPPAGIRVELGGYYASQQAAFRALLIVLALAAASVIAVMVIQFQSFVEPLVILLAAPLSFGGGLLLLDLTGTPLNVSSFMGLILLVGLVVKNGIILLDFTRRRMLADALPLEPAIREAARIRLRPILMTTLCTLFGLFPLALGLGAGSELQRPLALTVIGGLALSTPITLFLVPILLVAIRGRQFRLALSR